MPISKKKLAEKQKRKEYVEAARAEMREVFGYNELKKKHGKVKINNFPNLKVESKHQLSNGVGNGIRKPSAAEHPDAIQFPVGNSHKQGLELMYSKKYASQMNGKKT